MSEFRWAVSRTGYCWDLEHEDYGSVHKLVTYDAGQGVWVYLPMKATPDLFLEFARLKGNDGSYLRFAARYGQLTRSITVVPRPEVDSDAWRYDLSTLVRYPNLPPASRDDESSHFRNLEHALNCPNESIYSTWFDPTVERPCRDEDAQLWTSHTTEMRGLIKLWQTKPRGSALEEVRRGIETVLADRAVFAFDSETGQPSLAPIDLLSALWLQFAYAVGGAREYRACKRCAKLFPVSVPNSETGRRVRTDKLYCTTECQRDAAYALRKPKRQKAATEQAKRTTSSAARRKPGSGKV